MTYYPIFLDLCGRRCLVVEGDEIATRKAEGLLSAGASVRVISPKVTHAIEEHARKGRLCHLERKYLEGDFKGFFLLYAATGVPEVDVLMAREANSESLLLNVVDRPVLCGFITPAIVQRGDLSIAISTNGKCPGFAKRVRQEIESLLGPEFGAALESVAAQREMLMQSAAKDQRERRQRLETVLDLASNDLREGSKQ